MEKIFSFLQYFKPPTKSEFYMFLAVICAAFLLIEMSVWFGANVGDYYSSEPYVNAVMAR